MITESNILINALAFLQTKAAGHALSIPARFIDRQEIAGWCEKHGLAYWLNGKTLTLRMMRDGTHYLPPDPTIPKPGTPIDQLHPGNRFRMMADLPLLPQSSLSPDGNLIQNSITEGA